MRGAEIFKSMKLRRWFGCLLAGFAVAARAMAGTVATPSDRVPHGCNPVLLAVQTIADELVLTLNGPVPDLAYLVMVRSNKPYSQWLPFTYVIGVTNSGPVTVRFSLKSGEADGATQQTALHQIPARRLSQMQFTAGSGEDADGDALPALYEDLVTRTDPLNGGTANRGEYGYADPTSKTPGCPKA
jgi:hypothetical protein